jgi:adhesin HecA-like repeat protein
VAVSVSTANLTVTQTALGSFTNTSTGTITVASGRTLAVSGGTLDLDQGLVSGAGTLDVSGATYLFTAQTVTTPMQVSTTSIPGGITLAAGDTVRFLSGTTIADQVTNGGTLLVSGTVAFNGALTTQAGSMLRVGGLTVATSTVLTVASGFDNNGAIELTNGVGGYSGTLNVTAGTLVNTGTGTITSLTGAGGANRTLNAPLDNFGTVTTAYSMTVTGFVDQRSLLTISSGTLTIQGLLTLYTGSSTTVTSPGVLVKNGGCTNLGGTIGGTGTGATCP